MYLSATLVLEVRVHIHPNNIFNKQGSTQWCVLTISVPLGVGEAPVENSGGSYIIQNVAQKKLVPFGTFR